MDETEIEKQERQAMMRRLQSELFVLESDQSRLERKHELIVVEVKRIKNAIAHLEAELQNQEALLVDSERKKVMMEEEIKHHKKKMNAL